MKRDQPPEDPEIVPPEELAVERRQAMPVAEPTPIQLIERLITGPITAEGVGAIKELVALKEHMEDRKEQRDALKAFNTAFTKLQRIMPSIKADAAVMKDNRVLYRYCSFEEIWAQVQPHLAEHGFAVRFSQALHEGKVTVTCHLMHEGGHSVESNYSIRSGRGAPGMNETKEDAAASTIGQREALCDALNIVRRNRDEDARQLGGYVTPEQAEELEHRCKMVNANVPTFLKFAGGAKSFAEIPAVTYPLLDEFLKRKENPK